MTWQAPFTPSPVHATVRLPASKSLTNRHLILAALADGPSRLLAPLRARDTELMADALRALGTTIEDDGEDWEVAPGCLHGGSVDTGLAGTVMRFVPPLAGLADGPVVFDGDPYARKRPMQTLLDALRQAGMTVDDGGRGAMPFTVVGRGSVPGGAVSLDSSASSQFVSGLLLAGARFDGGIEVTHTGTRAVPSQPHLTMTVDVLRASGVEVGCPEPGHWQVAAGPITGGRRLIEPDLSNAAPFLAAALLTGGRVRVPDWPQQTSQPGAALRELLTAMGAGVQLDDRGLTVSGSGVVQGLDADLRDVTELVPVIAALAAVADRPSELRGLAHMRGHETDRLAALYAELSALGADVSEDADGLRISPKPLHAGRWRTYADHRMATAGALLGLIVDGVELDDISCTSKTLPDFPGRWAGMLNGRSG